MGKWKTFFGKLATIGQNAAGAAVEHYTGGVIPSTVITNRGKFKQWPPRPDEVEAGTGGGVTPGLSRDQLAVLGELWLAIPGQARLPTATATEIAVALVAGVFGWVEVTVPTQLDVDQYYTARHWLTEWARTGKQPDWPKVDPVDHNAASAEYQRAVEKVNRPWTPPEQPQAQTPAPNGPPRDWNGE